MSKHPHLLLGEDGEPVTVRMVQCRIATLRERAGLDIDTHGLRRTFATLCLQEGVAVNDVQELLGHEHLTTTEKYVRTNKMRAAKTVQKLSFGIEIDSKPIKEVPTVPPEDTVVSAPAQMKQNAAWTEWD